VARQYAAMLRANLAAGKYANFADADAFAKAVTADLQAVHRDGHLHLSALRPDQNGRREMRGPPAGSAILRSGWIADGVAYIDFAGFPGNEATLTDLRNFLASHKDAKTLIIDARRHHGGGPEEMNVLFPQIFDRETVLVGMDTRLAVEQSRGGPPPATDDFFRKVAGPEGVVRRVHMVVPAKDQGGLAKAQIFLLTSHDTGSAGEHLTLALKRTHRATVIGETTRGMGNYGSVQPIGTGFAAFIPVGRSFNPDNDEGWEGVGVKPDVEIAADRALDEALKRAGVKSTEQVALANLR
jgi:C-terminal processing protease CtpA/Prc